MAPLISVITATLNRGDMLTMAIESVMAQGLNDVEHIVVDGMSTDATGTLLARFAHLRVLRKPPEGVYHAWNSGLQLATGKLVCFLNSDDYIPSGAFDAVRSAGADYDLISGPAILEGASSDGLRPSRRIIDAPSILSLRPRDIISGVPITNARYVKRDLPATRLPFDQRFPLVADRLFWMQVLQMSPRHLIVDTPLYAYRAHAESLTLSGAPDARWRIAEELLRLAELGLLEELWPLPRDLLKEWHSWAALYVALLDLRSLGLGRFAGRLVRASEVDRYWLRRLPAQIKAHLVEAKARRGRPLSPN